MRALLAALLLCGCDRVFGVEPPGDSGDAALVTFTGSYVREYIYESAGAPQIEHVPYTTGELVPRVFQGALERPVEWNHASDTFSFEGTADEPYRLLMTFPELDLVGEIQSSAREIHYTNAIYSRPDAPLPTVPTTIGGMLSMSQAPPAGARYRLQTAGNWADVPLAPQFSSATSATYSAVWPDDVGLVDTAKSDRVFLTESVDTGTYRAIRRYDTGTLAMQPGPNSMNSTLVTPPISPRCTSIAAPLVELDARVTATYPDFMPSSATWNILGVASHEVGPDAALLVVESTTATTDVDYLDPFGLPQIVAATGVRYAILPTGPGTTVLTFALVRQHVILEHGECPTRPRTAISAGTITPPTRFRLQGASISGAMPEVAAVGGTTEVEVSWDPVTGAELYVLVLYDVTNSNFVGNFIRFFNVNEPRAIVESAVFVDGRRYLANVIAISGFPNAPTGDFRRSTYPLELSIGTSGVFTVSR